MFRLGIWLWRRISDFFTVVDLLEWFGWKAWVSAVVTSIVTAGATALMGGSPLAIFGLGIAGALIALGIANLFVHLRDSSRSVKPATPSTAPRGPRYKQHERDWHKLFELIPLKDAAIEFYEKLPRRFILKRAKERLGVDRVKDSPDELLNSAATYIATHIPVYGRPCNTNEALTKIGIDKINSSAFGDGATTLKHIFYPGANDYTDLCVKYDEFHALLEEEQMQVGYEGETG